MREVLYIKPIQEVTRPINLQELGLVRRLLLELRLTGDSLLEQRLTGVRRVSIASVDSRD